ncbi:class I SAM-dependent methyltransferase [Nannocystaceae bacterium ST9]
MGWYDLFANFYDRSLEPLYREQRRAAAEALELEPGHSVLDLPCGTGQSFAELAKRVTPGGVVLGVDFSDGMLDKAQARIDRATDWTNVHVIQADVHLLDDKRLVKTIARPQVDRLHVFLGLTAFPNWEAAFDRLWSLLAPGGRCVIVDVHAEQPSLQGHMVNLVARADIRRKVWAPLERVAEQFEKHDLPSRREHGGQLILASGRKHG